MRNTLCRAFLADLLFAQAGRPHQAHLQAVWLTGWPLLHATCAGHLRGLLQPVRGPAGQPAQAALVRPCQMLLQASAKLLTAQADSAAARAKCALQLTAVYTLSLQRTNAS